MMMDFLGFAAVIVFVIILLVMYQSFVNKEKEGATFRRLERVSGFRMDRHVIKVPNDGKPRAIALDASGRQVCFVEGDDLRLVPFDRIIGVEIDVDGVTVTKTSRSSQAVGVAAGAVLAGGVGAIIGGLSASSTSTQKVRSVTLRVLTNDLAQPTHRMAFLEPHSLEAPHPDHAMTEAREWADLLKVAIFQARQTPT